MNSKIPKVFISYSWDNEIHKDWVLDLATKLRLNRVDVILDIWELRAGRDKDYFMENSVRESDKVLLIMTPNYKIKAENRKGGVGNEISMIRAEKFNNQETEKFIPIVRSGNRDECTPLFVKSLIDIDMSIEDNFEKSFEELLRTIYDEPKNEKPPLGEKPQFTRPKKNFDLEVSDLNEETKQKGQKNIKKIDLGFDFESKSDVDFNLTIEEMPRLLKYSQKELVDILLNFEQEERKVILLFGSVMSGQSMFLASLMYFAHQADFKRWNAEISTNYPFDTKNINEMIKTLETCNVMCPTNMGQCDFIGINIVPNNKNLPILKLAFVHISGEHYEKIRNEGLNPQLELLLKCSTFVNPTIFLITPYKPYYEHSREDELHTSFLNHLKENMPKVYKTSKIHILVSQWDKKMEEIEIAKYLELYRPMLFDTMKGKESEPIMYGKYSVGNVIKLSEEPFLYVTHLSFRYPSRIWNCLYKSYTNKNLK
ncbi:MAG: toll/interleukin-1 receptor domain-containing protein [Bacteroidales bacterium]|nr:toll/interleukin-1 receptor domain-containing protein [Bacteroidales bacterium]